MMTRLLRGLIGALGVAFMLTGCGGSASTVLSQDDECRRSGGYWTGTKCELSGGGGGGGGY
jgi:hypothetical protein